MKFAGPERRGAVEHADVIEAEEAALENVPAFGILAVHPPREIHHQLVEDPLEKLAVRLPFHAPCDFVNAPDGPRLHRRIHVGKIPFVGGNLSVRMHVPFAHETERAAPSRIQDRSTPCYAMKSKIPRGVPGIFPLVRHRDDVGVVEMRPVVVSPVIATQIGLWAALNRLRASGGRRSDKTACTTAGRPEPGGGPGARLRSALGRCALRKTRRLP